MRVAKTIVGRLSLLLLLGAVFLAGLWIYGTWLPFREGARILDLPELKLGEVREPVARNGLSRSDTSLLKKRVDETLKPQWEITGWDAVDYALGRGVPPQPNKLTIQQAVVEMDMTGRVVAACPEDMIGRVYAFSDSIRSILRDAQGNLESAHYWFQDGSWEHDFRSDLAARGIQARHVSLVPIMNSSGKLIGVIGAGYGGSRVIDPASKLGDSPAWLRRLVNARDHNDLGPLPIAALIALLLHFLILPFWAGLDAGWRGMRPFAWGGLVLVTGWVGLLAYLIARLSPPRPCPNCGEQVLAKYRRCPVCGVSLLTRCPVCRTRIKPGWQYCPVCIGMPADTYGPGLPMDGPAPQLADAGPAMLTITVFDADTGAVCPNAQVSVEGPTVFGGLTNHSGVFQARRLQPGIYTVGATRIGSEPTQTEVDILEVSQKFVELRLKKQPGRIVGQVVDRLLRKPVAGARVYLDTSRLDRSTTTDASGVYTITDVPAGPYTVVAEAEGFATRAKLAEVSPGRQVAAGFALDPSPETVASTDEVQGLVQ